MCYDSQPLNMLSNIEPTGTLILGGHTLGNTSIPTITTSDIPTIGTITLGDLNYQNTFNSSSLNTTINSRAYSPNWTGPYITETDEGYISGQVMGNAEIKGKLTVGGVDIIATLEKINQRLAILKPNKELETRWERLKELADEYHALEQEIIEQEKIYEILKK